MLFLLVFLHGALIDQAHRLLTRHEVASSASSLPYPGAKVFTPGPFPWTSPEVISPILISPWIGAILALALVPVGLPDAVKQVCLCVGCVGWVGA